MNEILQRLWAGDEGQDLAEFGLLLSLLAIASIAILTLLGVEVSSLWNSAAEQIAGALQGSG